MVRQRTAPPLSWRLIITVVALCLGCSSSNSPTATPATPPTTAPTPSVAALGVELVEATKADDLYQIEKIELQIKK